MGMKLEEECQHLREENRFLRIQMAQRDERIQQLETALEQQQVLQQQMHEQNASLTQQVKALQERQAKDSHNSSLPPSSDRFTRQRKSLRRTSDKQTGGQAGHQGTSLHWSSSPDEVIEQHVEQCEACHQDLHEVAVCHVERRQVHDIPVPRLSVQEYRAEQKQCPVCHHITAAAFPPAVRAPMQYGSRIGAVAVYLVQQQLLPLARAAEVMVDLLGVPMSEGTIWSLIQRCASQLLDVEQQIKGALITAAVLHQDETGLYVLGKRRWMHVTSTRTLTHYHVDQRRGRQALEAIGILPKFHGITIHDRWGSYFLYDCDHALCLVHLLRELVFLAEEQHAVWAADLTDLLLEMKSATEQARAQGKRWMHPLEVADWETAVLRVLAEGECVTPRATSPPGTKGRCTQSAARNLLDSLQKHQKALFCFLEDLRVDFDNNLAERDLRMIKVQQKVSGCFRSEAGAQAFSRIRGYVSTLRKQGLPLLSALQATLDGYPVLPSLVPT
jgi:transposase